MRKIRRVLSRRELAPSIALGGTSLQQLTGHRKLNVVLILADNLSYGDLGCYGGPIRTPNIDSLARQGLRFTHAYAATMCSPSRSMLLTGRYAERSRLPSVIWQFQTDRGLPLSEITLGDMFKTSGYRTACYGKWHLGHGPQFEPIKRGFEDFLGIPYSLDMPPCPLLDGTDVVEKEVNRETLASKIANRAVQFINKHHNEPFFLYLPHTAPHPPISASEQFRGKSPAGLYGDAVEEMDAGVGRVLAALKKHGIERNTLVIFTSDNGPYGHLGSTGRLRGVSYHTFEGGMRVPLIVRWPGRISPRQSSRQVVTLMDIAPTLVNVCGLRRPDTSFDGIDISSVLARPETVLDREPLLYFDFNYNVQCARLGKYKLHLSRHDEVCLFGPPLPYLREIRARIRAGNVINLPLLPPELYDLEIDPGECYDVADRYPDVIQKIRTKVERLIANLPDEVQTAYAETMKRDTFPQEQGRLPRPRPQTNSGS
jgi:arylsulfatase A